MRLNSVLFIAAVLLTAPSARALDLRLGMVGGFGQSVVSARGGSQAESPGMFGAYVDYAVNSRQTIGLEHVRTFAMKPVSTGVSISGLTTRWYYINPAPAGVTGANEGTYLYEKYLAPYLGAGIGFSQSSLLPANEDAAVTNSVGVYAKLRAGIDMPWLDRVGFNAESSVATTFAGFGTVTMFNLNTGFYYYF